MTSSAGSTRHPTSTPARRWVDWQRRHAAPTLHQPLSHAASRRDSSPFRGAEGFAEVCGVGASVYHDADTVVFLQPVRGGVLDAPRSRDRRAELDASVRLDRLHLRHHGAPTLRLQPNDSYSAGTARAPFRAGVRGCPSSQAGRAWKISPYGVWVGVSEQLASPARPRIVHAKRTGLRTGPFCAEMPLGVSCLIIWS